MSSRILCAALCVAAVVATPMVASASEGRGQPFAAAQYYRTNITLEAFRGNPRSFLRSDAAYTELRRHVASLRGGGSLDDAQFRALLLSDEVRVVACQGNVHTSGLVTGGSGWFIRACYRGEQLVEVRTSAGWTSALSLACMNPVQGPVQPVSPPPPPPAAPPPPAGPPPPPAAPPPPPVAVAPPRAPISVSYTNMQPAQASVLVGAPFIGYAGGGRADSGASYGGAMAGSSTNITVTGGSGCTSGCGPRTH